MRAVVRRLQARPWIYLYATIAVPVIYGASFPAGIVWLGWIGFVPWFVATRIASTRGAIVLCCISTLLGSYFCTPWLADAVANYYQQPLAVGLALFAGVWLVTISPFLIAFTLSFRELARRSSAWLPLLTAAAWTGAELGRARLFVGDPFGLFGYSQVTAMPLVQIADVTGVYGLTFLPMAVNAALAELYLARFGASWPGVAVATRAAARRGVAFVVAVSVAAFGYGQLRLAGGDSAFEAAAPTRIAVVQANLDLGSQWHQEFYGRNLAEYMKLSAEAAQSNGAALLFWPESAMTFFLEEEVAFRLSLASLLSPLRAQLVAGGPRRVAQGEEYYNSAFVIAPSGEIVATYDKQRLLPFAEYFPFGGISLLRRHFARVREFAPGGPANLLPTVAGNAGILICNESMFGETAGERVRDGAEYLVNLANDSWLGDPMYAAEAFDMARLRAVEQRRYLVRASTSGPSAIIDPLGRVVTLTGADARATLAGEIRPLRQLTFYARWGDVFGLGCALLPLGLIAARRLAERRARLPVRTELVAGG
jgi:apolipoprotein N-acyltransferase